MRCQRAILPCICSSGSLRRHSMPPDWGKVAKVETLSLFWRKGGPKRKARIRRQFSTDFACLSGWPRGLASVYFLRGLHAGNSPTWSGRRTRTRDALPGRQVLRISPPASHKTPETGDFSREDIVRHFRARSLALWRFLPICPAARIAHGHVEYGDRWRRYDGGQAKIDVPVASYRGHSRIQWHHPQVRNGLRL
jgi:hypothetical protein